MQTNLIEQFISAKTRPKLLQTIKTPYRKILYLVATLICKTRFKSQKGRKN